MNRCFWGEKKRWLSLLTAFFLLLSSSGVAFAVEEVTGSGITEGAITEEENVSHGAITEGAITEEESVSEGAITTGGIANGAITEGGFTSGSAITDWGGIPSDWSISEMEDAVEAGLIPEGFQCTFQDPITKGNFTKLIANFVMQQEGMPLDEIVSSRGIEMPVNPFIDINDPEVTAMNALGLVYGYENRFSPEETLDRETACALLERAARFLGNENPNGMPQTFYDGGKFSDWAVESIKYIVSQKTPEGLSVMTGYEGKFDPKSYCTAEQTIAMVYRLQEALTLPGQEGWKDATGWRLGTVLLSAAGDCTFGRDHDAAYSNSFDEVYDKNGPAYFFRNVPQFFYDDVTIVNFEGTLTTANRPAVKTFRFKGDPAYTEILKQGSVEVVNFSNNHAMDYLQVGYDDTIRYLQEADIGVCSEYLAHIREINGVKVGFYGVRTMSGSFVQSQKDTIQFCIDVLKENGAQVIVASHHWGQEYTFVHNKMQEQVAHFSIDNGADLVLGHHPHVLQDMETYKGKQIIYSLGNFSFGGNKNPKKKETIVFQQSFVVDLDTGELVDTDYEIYPYMLSSVSYKNDYQPTPATGADAKRILQVFGQ